MLRHENTIDEALEGKLLWSYRTGEDVARNEAIDGIVYAVVGPWGNEELQVIDSSSGRLMWRHRDASVPAVFNGTAYVNVGQLGNWTQGLHAVRALSGEPLWHYSGFSWAVADGTVFAGVGHWSERKLHALNALSGDLLWKYEPPEIVHRIEVFDGAVYVVVGTHIYKDLRKLDAASGKVRWKYDPEGLVGSQLPTTAANGVVYILVGPDGYRKLHALDSQTGKVLYEYLVRHETAWPLISNGVLYISAGIEGSRSIHALDAQSGQIIWKYEPVGDAILTKESDSVVYVSVGTDGRRALHALDGMTGELLWLHQAQRPWFYSTASGGVVYVASTDRHLYALNAKSGEVIKIFKLGGQVSSFPEVSDGVVYFGSSDGHLYAVGALSSDFDNDGVLETTLGLPPDCIIGITLSPGDRCVNGHLTLSASTDVVVDKICLESDGAEDYCLAVQAGRSGLVSRPLTLEYFGNLYFLVWKAGKWTIEGLP